MSTTAQEQKQFLINSIEHFQLEGVEVRQRIVNDKRATVGRFYLMKGTGIISPTLDFHRMSSFIYGMGAYKQNFKN